MCFHARLLLFSGLLAKIFSSPLWGETGDVDGSRDYAGFPRMPGYVITDFNEDNPADYNFPVARPLPIDASHIETVHVTGHRYVIRYELSPDRPAPTLLQSQRYYEKLAAAAGYTLEKTGAVGDVTETFHLARSGHSVWVYLEPAITVDMLTVVEAKGEVAPPPVPVAPASPPVFIPVPGSGPQLAPAPHLALSTPVTRSAAAPVPAPVGKPVPPAKSVSTASPPAVAPATAKDDPCYLALMKDRRLVLPLTFLPGKPDLDADSQPVIDRVVAMMERHPELFLEVDGHTDNTGDPDFNLTLSRERANVVCALVTEGHIDAKRLAAAGLGGSQPLAEENSAEGRQKNRRIELVVRNESPAKTAPPRDTAAKKSPAKKAAAAKSPPKDDSTPDETPVFHKPAPDGINYYPAPGTNSSSSASNTAR